MNCCSLLLWGFIQAKHIVGSCQLLQSDIIHPPSHVFPFVTPSGLASVNWLCFWDSTCFLLQLELWCFTFSSFLLQCWGSQSGYNCPPITLSLDLVPSSVCQLLTSFLLGFLLTVLSVVYLPNDKSCVGMWLGHAQTFLQYFLLQDS